MFFAIMCILIYMLPAIIAGARSHKSYGSVAVVNIFLGWTFIGWIAALSMAFSSGATEPPQHPNSRCVLAPSVGDTEE